ncbi:MAG: metallophosphoesterase [Hyphomicrobiales bacterium]|nr:metallophosphoesterase [Hyphomicrobiales bacterium]
MALWIGILFGFVVLGGLLGVYALFEAAREPVMTRYQLTPEGWPDGLRLRLVVLTDPHACEPWMSARRLSEIVRCANAQDADAMLLVGDYDHAMPFITSRVPPDEWARVLGALKAPLGVHAVLGNHDWDNDRVARWQARGNKTFSSMPYARQHLEAEGVLVHSNSAAPIEKDGFRIWIAGLEDQYAIVAQGGLFRRKPVGLDDLPATLAPTADSEPVILMAHEPDIFPQVPSSVSLTVSGHTHGGQIRFFGFAPVVPSVYGRRYVYGHIVEEGRYLLVSRGLGCSGLPLRLGCPPEIVVVELGKPLV